MSKKQFTRLKPLGNGYCIYLKKEHLCHLRAYKDSDICLTLNKNGTITISKAKYSDRIIEDIINQLDLANPS